MSLYSSIFGVPVICRENNLKIGIVKEVLYCCKSRSVFGIAVEERGIFRPIKYIPVGHIIEVNETCIVTDSADCIGNLDNPKELCSKLENSDKLGINTFVYSKDGKLVGQIKDIIFDFSEHTIKGYIISKSCFEDIFSKRIVVKNNIAIDENLNKFKVFE